MKFVIFHGSFGGPESNWFPELKEKLTSFNQEAIIPQLPTENWEEVTKAGSKKTPKNQNLESWLRAFGKVYKTFKKGEKLCFISHSLGGLFILHLVDKYNLQLDSAIFVSPFLGKLGRSWQIDLVNQSFYKTNFNFSKFKKLIPLSYVLYSDNDPYVERKFSMDFAEKLDSSLIFVSKAGHMNAEVNLNEFPLVFELCKTRLDLSLYQKYLAHRRELFSVDYFKGKQEEVVYLRPEEVFDEGVFHFRNLKKEGFCTFFTGIKFWDTQSKYMEEARKAARRVSLARVFIIDNLEDLDRPILLEQIRLDIASGVKVYLCFYETIKDLVPEPDFGVWDDDYLCIVKFNNKKEVVEVKLSSRRKEITEAQKWQREIFKKAIRIYNSDEDIKKFVKIYLIPLGLK